MARDVADTHEPSLRWRLGLGMGERRHGMRPALRAGASGLAPGRLASGHESRGAHGGRDSGPALYEYQGECYSPAFSAKPPPQSLGQ